MIHKIFKYLILLSIVSMGLTAGNLFALEINLNRLFGAGKDVVTAVTGIDEKDEISVGRELAGRMLGAAPLVDDKELQAYVNRVGRWLASQTDRPDLPWRFGVVNTSSINAFAAPGGHVLITRGLYDLLENEAQLAGVLGHEIGHIIRRHHITVMQKSAAISAGAKLAQRDDRNFLVNNLIGSGAEVMARGLDKSAEFEADAIAVVLAARGGYSPYGLVEVLHKIAARGASDASLALLFSTHPRAGERLSELGDKLVPHVAALPAGQEPQIRRVSVTAAASAQSTPAPDGARALQDPGTNSGESPQPAKKSAPGLDAGGILRGIMGR